MHINFLCLFKATEMKGKIWDSNRVFCGGSSSRPCRTSTQLVRSDMLSSSGRSGLGANTALATAATRELKNRARAHLHEIGRMRAGPVLMLPGSVPAFLPVPQASHEANQAQCHQQQDPEHGKRPSAGKRQGGGRRPEVQLMRHRGRLVPA